METTDSEDVGAKTELSGKLDSEGVAPGLNLDSQSREKGPPADVSTSTTENKEKQVPLGSEGQDQDGENTKEAGGIGQAADALKVAENEQVARPVQQKKPPVSAETSDAARRQRKARVHRACACNWEDCAKLAAEFAELEDQYQRGGNDFTEHWHQLTEERDATKARMEAYTHYLCLTEEKLKSGRFNVSRHHWRPKQLQIIYGNRMARGTPVSKAMYLKTLEAGETIEEEGDKALKGSFFHEKNQCTLYHYVPNYTRQEVLRDLEGLRAEKQRRDALEVQKQQHHIAQQESLARRGRLEQLQEERLRKRRAASDPSSSPRKAAKLSGGTTAQAAGRTQELQSDLDMALAELETKQKEIERLKKKHAAEKKVALQQHLALFQKHFQAEVAKLVQQHAIEKKEMERKHNERASKLISEHNKERNSLSRRCSQAEKKCREAHETRDHYMFTTLNDIVNDYGGLSRLTIFSDVWHEQYPDAAQHFFGFPSWDECKFHCRNMFPEELAKAELPKRAMFLNAAMLSNKTVEVSAFERCLMARMCLHSMHIRRRVARVFGLSEHHAGKIINEWIPKWEAVKDQLAPVLRKTRKRRSEMEDEPPPPPHDTTNNNNEEGAVGGDAAPDNDALPPSPPQPMAAAVAAPEGVRLQKIGGREQAPSQQQEQAPSQQQAPPPPPPHEYHHQQQQHPPPPPHFHHY